MILPASARWCLRGAIGALVLLCFVPFALLLGDSVWNGRAITFDAYANVLADGRQWTLLWNTVRLGVLGAGGAIVLGTPYAFLISRTDLPFRRIFSALFGVPILIPPVILAWAWTKMPSWFLPASFHTIWGTVFVFSLCYFPIVTLLGARAFRSVDAGLEEAALLMGGRRRAFFSVGLPVVIPAALSGGLLAFIFVISDYSLPNLVTTLGPSLNVYSQEIFSNASQTESIPKATASALPLILLTGISMAALLRLRAYRPAGVVTGDFRAPKIWPLGRARWIAFAFCAVVTLSSSIGPLGVLLVKAGGLSSYRETLKGSGPRKDILSSLATSAIGSTLMVLLGLFLVYAIVRARTLRRGRLLEAATILPLAFPALLTGIALIRVWNRPWPVFDWVYTSKAIVIVVLIVRYLPFPVVALASRLRLVDPELEEAGAIAGVSWWRRWFRILLPILRNGIASAWILAFLFSMRELDTMILIPEGNDSLMNRMFNVMHFGKDSEIAAISVVTVFLISLPLLLYTLLTNRKLDVV